MSWSGLSSTAMAEAKDHASGMTSAGASLRDTAKWLASGIFATAAGIFAGSSLTNFGSLGPDRQATRFYLALIGAAAGFLALGWLFRRVVSVLTMESASLTLLAEAEADESDSFHEVANEVARKYRDYFPEGASTLKEAVAAFNRVNPASPDWANVGEFTDIVLADASFLAVRKKFGKLTRDLPWAGILAALGFGLFAWAANPPESPTPQPVGRGVSVSVSVDGNTSADRPQR
jgi:hypothetical protein